MFVKHTFKCKKDDQSTYCIASFPKSGNTWVRFFIANLYNQIEPIYPEIDFYNIHDIVPEIGKEETFIFQNFPNVYKTHDQYNKSFSPVILILRNPYDVILSYYYYLNGEQKNNITLSEVIHHKQYGIDSIVTHTNSYINNCKELLIITYEQLHSVPFKYFSKIASFLNINFKQQDITTAIEKSSFEQMKAIELNKGRKYGSMDFTFMHKGKIGEGYSQINYKDLAYISQRIKKAPITNLLYG